MCASSLCNVFNTCQTSFYCVHIKTTILVLLTFKQYRAGSSEIPACHYFCYPAALFDISVPPYIGQVTHICRINSVKDTDRLFFRFMLICNNQDLKELHLLSISIEKVSEF